MPDIVWNVLGFIVAISILVCFHELGHYWMARRLGVKVLRFSLGWGKPFKSFHSRDGVEWALAPYPIGGYVKMLDEREGPVPEHERHLAFNNQSVPRRMAILVAGPAANFLLAIALYWLVFVIGTDGLKPVIAEPRAGTVAAQAGLHHRDMIVAMNGEAIATWEDFGDVIIGQVVSREPIELAVRDAQGNERTVHLDVSRIRIEPEQMFADLGLEPVDLGPAMIKAVLPGTPAESAGLQAGDLILSIDGQPMAGRRSVISYVSKRPGQSITLQIRRGSDLLSYHLVLARIEEGGQVIGRMGADVAIPPDLWQDLRAKRRLDALSAVPAAVRQTWEMTSLTLRMLGYLVAGEISAKNVSGPIQIAQVTGDAAQAGLVFFVKVMAIISVSLGVLNMLPVPLLDGGHLLLYAIEGIKGRPLSERLQVASQYIGIAFIGMLMVLAFYNDIMRLI